MQCYGNVGKWDDSAAEEAFHDAKRRYWEKINCLPCETPLPQDNLYIDEINWNPCIDPKQISDLDQEYFNPDEVAKAQTSQTSVGSRNSAVPVRHLVENDENPDEVPCGSTIQWGKNIKSMNSKDATNPWEQSCTVVDKSLRNNAWGGSADKDPIQEDGHHWVQTAKAMDSRDVNNPWEQSHVQCDESLRNNAWNDSPVKDPAWAVRSQLDQNAKSINQKDVSNPWEQRLSQVGVSNARKGYAGMDRQGVRTSWSLKNTRKESTIETTPKRVGAYSSQYAGSKFFWNNGQKGSQAESSRWRKKLTDKPGSAGNSGDKKWVRVDDRSRGPRQWNNISSHEQQDPVNGENTRQQGFPSHGGLSGGNRWSEQGNKSGVRKQLQIYNKESKNVSYKGSHRGGKIEQSGFRKREGSLQHSPRHKTSRFHDDSYDNT